jgi:hypothetical protein
MGAYGKENVYFYIFLASALVGEALSTSSSCPSILKESSSYTNQTGGCVGPIAGQNDMEK